MIKKKSGTEPIFMGCLSKSGASLFRTIVGRHPNIFGGDGFETHWFSEEIYASWNDPDTRRQEWLRNWFEVSREEQRAIMKASSDAADYFSRFMDRCADQAKKPRWLEKTPANLLHFDLIRSHWSPFKFIHVVREYKDIYASWTTKNLGTLKETTPEEFVSIVRKSYSQVEHLLGTTTETYCEVKYEDVVLDTRSTLIRVLDFLGEPYVDGMENYQGNSVELEKVKAIMGKDSNTSKSLKKPIFNSSIGQWKTLVTEPAAAFIDEELKEYRERLGYVSV